MDTIGAYSARGKILQKQGKDFFVVIWPDIPYYLALPNKLVGFVQTILKPNFSIQEIEDDLFHDNDCKRLYDFFVKHEIISMTNIPVDISEKPPQELYYISLQVTEKCNLRCKHCYASAGEANYSHELTVDEWKNIIDSVDEIANHKRVIPIITGGEPFVRKDIMQIIDYTMSKMPNVVVVTNALLLTQETIEQLKARKGLLVQVSLDGACRETHEYIRGQGTFDKTLENIKALIKAGIRIGLSPICTEKFFEEIDAYFELAKELGVVTVQLQPVQYIGRAMKDPNIKRLNGDKLIQKIMELYFNESYYPLVREGLESRSVIHVRGLNKLKNCGTGQGTIYICANGDIYSCPNMMHSDYRIGNALKDNIKDLYFNSPVYQKLRSLNVNRDYGRECMECEVKHFCGGGCRGVCIANTGNINGKAVECANLKAYFSEIIWTICEKKGFYRQETLAWLNYKKAHY